MSDAHTTCVALGGRLVRLHSADEIDELKADNSLFPGGSGILGALDGWIHLLIV